MSSTAPLTYDQAGVNYDLIDPLKVTAQRAAAATASHLASHGFSEVQASRGESAYVVDVGPFYVASIVECLGTKTLVADEMSKLTGKSFYAGIAQDTIAMAINDLITVGATPLVVQAYWAAGGSDWFGDKLRAAPEVTKKLKPAEIDALLDESHHFRHVDTIFKRVFGSAGPKAPRKAARRKR